jgi:tetratricopeptide (TPR) repeat protein
MHVNRTLLDAVAWGELPRQFVDEIEGEHLAARCPVCEVEILAHEAARGRAGGRSAAVIRNPIERIRRRLGLSEGELQARDREARRWVRKILRLAPGKRRGRVRGAYTQYRGPIFGVLLLEEARRKIPADPAEALSLAEAVLVSCERSALYRPDPEIQAPALAVCGNAKRALGRFREGDEDLAEARRLLDSPGVTDPATPAELYSYLGSLRKDQGRLEEAAVCLARAAKLYDLLGDREKAARVLLTLSIVHHRRHDLDAAIGATEEALALLAPDSDAWLRASAHFNRASYLHARGDVDQAEAELSAHEELLAAEGDWGAFHVAWLRARIAWSRGKLSTAQRLYTEVRKRALERGIPFDAALVSLELALVHLARGRTGRVKTLAFEALRVFAEQKVEREVRAGLDLLEAAARREALTREILESAIATLERARHSPGRGTA